jgi:hypothetical protein
MHSLLSGPLSTETLTVKIAGLPASLQGKKLVQMSDFHYDGLRLTEKMLEKAIAISNQAQPDLVLLTGDYVTTSPAPIHQLVLQLKKLQSNSGIYAILGNHDICYRQSKAEVTTALTNIGVNVLWNQIAYPLGQELPLVGLADKFSKEFNPAPVMNQLDPATPRIVLSHNPDTAKMASRLAIIWTYPRGTSPHPRNRPHRALLQKNLAKNTFKSPPSSAILAKRVLCSTPLGMGRRVTSARKKSAICQPWLGNLFPRTFILPPRSYFNHPRK